MVGVFGAEMVMSFRFSGEGPKVGVFGQFRTAQVGLESAFEWSYLCVVMLWCYCHERITCSCVLIFVNIYMLDILTCMMIVDKFC